jgi:mannose-6-phosphate isomerase-like protein (cupin superfamily)
LHESADTESFRFVMRGDASAVRLQRYFRDLPVTAEPVELAPGGSKERNMHPQGNPLEEVYVVLRGNVEMMVDGVNHQLRPGDAVIATPESSHHLRNPGAEPAELLVIWAGPGTPIDWSSDASGLTDHAVAPTETPKRRPERGIE